MEIRVNGESLEKLHNTLCDSGLNVTSLSDRMCDVADVNLEMTIQGIDMVKEYILNVISMF